MTASEIRGYNLVLKVDPDLINRAATVNHAFARIIEYELQDWLQLFASKAVDYEEDAQELGIKAQFVDINRKVGKMKRVMWDGKTLHGPEKLPEIIQDVIAHCFLALDMIHRQQSELQATENGG